MPLLYDVLFWPSDPPPFDLNKNMYFFQIVGDLLKFASLVSCLPKTQWGEIFSEGAFLFNEPEFSRNFYKVAHWKSKKVYKKRKRKSINQQKKGAKILEKSDVLLWLSYLPPLSDFVPFCLTPPSPPKIGHHLCMSPNANNFKMADKSRWVGKIRDHGALQVREHT